MEITGSYSFRAELEDVWNLLMDPKAIARALPGVNEMVPVEGESLTWKAVAKIGVASVNGSYKGTVRMSDIEPHQRYRLTVSGEGQQSIINGTALFTLNYDPQQKVTNVSWTAEANVAGRLAGVAQRMVKAAADLLSRQFFSALASQLPSGSEATSANPTP